MELSKDETEYLEWVAANVRPEIAKELLMDEGTPYSPRCAAAWLNSVGENGYVEIGGQYTLSGNPVTGHFPELAAELWGD